MSSYGIMIADAAAVGLRYANRLITGIPSDRFARFSAPGGTVIEANHPAFVIGHLSLYPVRVLDLLGLDTASAKPQQDYDKLFSKEAKCVDDPQGNIYPSSGQLITFFNDGYQLAIDAMRSATDERLSVENPIDSPMKQACPTLGAMLTYFLTGHVTGHLGQISTWRRMEHLPPA